MEININYEYEISQLLKNCFKKKNKYIKYVY